MSSNVNGGTCPKCGQKMALKKGKYGEFHGCSGYPACRYTIKVTN